MQKRCDATYIVIFLVGCRLEGRDPFLHFATGIGAQDERPERGDDLIRCKLPRAEMGAGKEREQRA